MGLPVTTIVFGLLVLLRLVGLLATCPLLGLETIPWRVRLGLGAALAVLVTVQLPPAGPAPGDLLGLGLLGAAEVLLGLALGLTVSLFVHGVRMAGQLAGIQMGLGFAMLVDPMTGDQASVLSRLLGLTAVLAILGFNGHHIMLRGLSLSFQHLPPGEAWRSLIGAAQAVPAAGATLFMTALLVAAPALAAVFCLKAAMAVMARAAPQIHILAVGFIFTIVVGVLVVAWSLGGLGETLRGGFERAAEQALGLLAVR